MYTDIVFNPITKYLIIFLISYMYLNHMKFGQVQLIHTLCFIIILVITIDIYEFADYMHLLQMRNDE